jgi:phosphoribosylglycinamide formyltransferase 1
MSAAIVSSLSVVVLCSGRGSNLQALIDAQANGTLAIAIRAVVSDKPDCHALERARGEGIEAIALRARNFGDRASFDQALFGAIAKLDPQLLVCAGYMRIIDADVVRQWHGRMINIHPSLLPKYAGLHTHQRALDADDSEHGASVHFVTAELDGGPLIAQAALPVRAEDSAATLAARLLPLEHRLLCASVGAFACGEIALTDNRVVYRGEVLRAPLKLSARGQLSAR